MEEELLRLYEATGTASVFPSRADKSFPVDKEVKKLTGDEYVKYATVKGQTSYKLLTALTNSAAYKAMNDETKADVVSEVYAYANAVAKMEVSDYKPESSMKWVTKAIEAEKDYGINATTYIGLKVESAKIEPLRYADGRDKNKDGKPDSIENSESLLKMQAIYSTPGLTDKQRQAMFEYLDINQSVRHYNKTLVNQKLEALKKKAK